MMEASFEAESALYKYNPDHIPKPIAWGNYESDPKTWFCLLEFHDMAEEVLDPTEFVPIIVQIHKASMGESPDGKYGFHVPTHLANIPNDNTWQASWEVWFTQAMKKMFDVEEQAHGKDMRLEELKKGLYEKIIPRLLRPLETGGRSIQPCLLHSDLWPGNAMLDNDTNRIIIFDSCAFWGHNEADLGSWRAPRYMMGRPFFREYQKAMGISEPQEDWDDRIALYAL
jgi:protein-ribulosamine 3-kinase